MELTPDGLEDWMIQQAHNGGSADTSGTRPASNRTSTAAVVKPNIANFPEWLHAEQWIGFENSMVMALKACGCYYIVDPAKEPTVAQQGRTAFEEHNAFILSVLQLKTKKVSGAHTCIAPFATVNAMDARKAWLALKAAFGQGEASRNHRLNLEEKLDKMRITSRASAGFLPAFNKFMDMMNELDQTVSGDELSDTRKITMLLKFCECDPLTVQHMNGFRSRQREMKTFAEQMNQVYVPPKFPGYVTELQEYYRSGDNNDERFRQGQATPNGRRNRQVHQVDRQGPRGGNSSGRGQGRAPSGRGQGQGGRGGRGNQGGNRGGRSGRDSGRGGRQGRGPGHVNLNEPQPADSLTIAEQYCPRSIHASVFCSLEPHVSR